MNRRMHWIVALAGGALTSTGLAQVTLHSTLGIVNSQSYDRADPDLAGGMGFFGIPVEAESADDFTLATVATLTQVTLDYLTFFGQAPAGGVQVNILSDAAGIPGALIYSTQAQITSVTSFTDTVFGLAGERITASVNLPLAASTYWLTMKPIDYTAGGDAYFSVRDSTYVLGASVMGRDIAGGLYGFTNWTTLLSPASGGTTSMEIRGIPVPTPGVLAGLGAAIGVCGVRRRRCATGGSCPPARG
ncbi:MAG: PEP-CTERM sorting domain-containing protein [Phycisphaerales bacterium]|nr:PEP-CTERM sorting domain-containing protein [Phycisphaerales bacterium]